MCIRDSFLGGLRVLQHPLRGLGHFPQVVRRDLGGHPDRDPGAAVDQQVREARGQDVGLLVLAVVVVVEVDLSLIHI